MCNTVISGESETMEGLPEDDRFRALFDPDPDCAKREFALLMFKLQKYFGWRCHADPEELASQTVWRAMKRIADGATVPDITSFCYGIAANVKKEEWKRRREEEITTDPVSPERSLFGLRSSEQAVLVEQCLQKIPTEARILLREYYWGDRVRLAEDRRLTGNALRIKVFRALEEIREQVIGKGVGSET